MHFNDGRTRSVGAMFTNNGRARFTVWAPYADRLELELLSPAARRHAMEQTEGGYWTTELADVPADARYGYRLNGADVRPDPASRYQPEGVRGLSSICPTYRMDTGNWTGLPLHEYIIYELHVGTYTGEGTFVSIIPHLPELKDLGVTAIEIMPVAQFPGDRNWGYDGVFPYAAQNTYGGPDGLRQLVSACHDQGIAVVLDVVYNHLGPEGNYFRDFGPYFTERYRTPWGDAINFDGPDSDPVRRFFLENALYWIEEFGIDALRLDAVHAIYDRSAYPFLQELADLVRAKADELGRQVFLIAESDLNDPRVVKPAEKGGFGIHAQWSDEFHHALHTLVTGEHCGYYSDFGSLSQMAKAMAEGWVYSGNYSPHRRVCFGSSPRDVAAHQLVVCSQNHDQVGNRMLGDRLAHIAGPAAARLAAATVLLSPYIPLLFMGEEHGEDAPFLYHVSHSDPELQEAVRQGRKREFRSFLDQGEPPDPQARETFERSRINHGAESDGTHANMRDWYRQLLALRKSHPALRRLSKDDMQVSCFETAECIGVLRTSAEGDAWILLHFGSRERHGEVALPQGCWKLALNSEPQSRAPMRAEGALRMQLAPFQVLVYESA